MANLSSEQMVEEAEPPRTTPSSPSQTRQNHVEGIDSLRLLLATWVVLHHGGFIPLRSLVVFLHTPRIIWGIADSLFNGSAAVMAFFAISGFCIHVNFKAGRHVSLLSYYIRREFRIVPPVLAMFVIGEITNTFTFMVGTWSLICEEFYYILYPLFRVRLVTKGFKKLFICSVICWIALQLISPGDKYPFSRGPALTWLVCASVWILGAALAEDVSNGRSFLARLRLSRVKLPIWIWRLLLFLASVGCNLVIHTTVSVQWVLIPFGWFACLWLEQEIIRFRLRPPKLLFERMGKASYSLYLSHSFIIAAAWNYKQRHAGSYSVVDIHFLPLSIWVPMIFGVFAFAAIVYFCVELPSHKLARYLGKRF